MSASAEGGIRFGQYVLLRRIARGGMAEVFLAQQRGLEGFDRRVAVKRILPHLADAPDFVKMFLKEAQLAAQLTHPNVVHIYDFGKFDGDYFIAMEFVDGVHAGQLFKHGEKEKLPPTMVARIGADAATALHYAHELKNSAGKPLGLVHRDVSPANIMVSFDGVVKLCDFGIAKAAALTDQLTNPGQVKGKYAYMSPEQTIAAPLDGRSDVFSLAIVLWELLAGKTIVPRGDAVEAMRAIRDGKLPAISTVAPRTPPALAKAITWALQTRREIRATAMDFAQALEAFIKSSPELATPMQLGSWVRQRFAGVSTGQHAAIPGVSIGTKVAPGTMMSPETSGSPGTALVDGTKLGTVTPDAVLAASDVRSGDDLLDAAETIDVSGDELSAEQPHAHDAANEATMIDPGVRAAVETTERDGELVHDSINTEETIMRSGAFRQQMSAGPSVVPTMIAPKLEHRPSSVPGLSDSKVRHPTPVPSAPDSTAGMRRAQRTKMALVFGGLFALTLVSFLIALAARSPSKVAVRDAGIDGPRVAAVAGDARTAAPAVVGDAGAASAGDAGVAIAGDAGVANDAAATAVLSDAREPTIPIDAAITDPVILEVRTKPSGGTVKVGGETRGDPAKFALGPGTYQIIAELEGYAAEKRQVELSKGVDLVQEIAFTRKLPGHGRQPPMGKLTARTAPYAVVFHNNKRLGETPFADLELPVGTYRLVFKNPNRASVTKTVKITAGKTAKLSFNLPP